MARVIRHIICNLFAGAALGEVEDIRLSVIGNYLNENAIRSFSRAKPFISIPAVHPEIRPKIKRADKFRNPRLLRSVYRRLACIRCAVVDRPVRSGCREGEQE